MESAQALGQKILEPTLKFNIGGYLFEPSYVQAAAIVFLVFLLILTLARLRRMYVHWSLKGASAMVFLGFFLAVIIEGFLILGGRTFLTEILGWKNAPKPIQTAVDSGRSRLVDVLGVTDEIPESKAKEEPSAQSVFGDFASLSTEEKKEVGKLICSP